MKQQHCILKKSVVFERWFIVAVDDETLGWSGSRWVPVSAIGLPAGDTQVCNFDSFNDASIYTLRVGLKVVGIRE